MNLINQIQIDGVLSRDSYTKVAAFVDGEPRGEAYLNYDNNYDAYYAYLSVYSNTAFGEDVTFKVWDALNGKVLVAKADDQASVKFLQNEVKGTKKNPVLMQTGQTADQHIQLNKGWTWVSFSLSMIPVSIRLRIFLQMSI